MREFPLVKWAVAQSYRGDNPAGDAIAAALPKTAVLQQHMRALPHTEVGAALARVKGSGAYLGTMLAFEFLVPLHRGFDWLGWLR